MDRVKHFDLNDTRVRDVNQYLHHALPTESPDRIDIRNPDGLHSIAVGMDHAVPVDIHGHAGYFTAGMNKQASITIHGNVGWSVAENINKCHNGSQGQTKGQTQESSLQ